MNVYGTSLPLSIYMSISAFLSIMSEFEHGVSGRSLYILSMMFQHEVSIF